jgi:hypothetical protein
MEKAMTLTIVNVMGPRTAPLFFEDDAWTPRQKNNDFGTWKV